MKIIDGKTISPGYAHGRAEILGAEQQDFSKSKIHEDKIDTELARFHSALDASYRDLQQLQARVEAELGTESAEIFSATGRRPDWRGSPGAGTGAAPDCNHQKAKL